LFADIEDAFGVARNSADSEALIVDLIPGALTTNSTNGVVASNAAADSIVEDLVDSTALDTEAC